MKRFLAAAAAIAAILMIGTATVGAPAWGAGVAGYGLSALSAGVRYQLNSPGFLPTGDPAEGNVLEFDVPLARTSVSQGPVINALASPLYPGDTAAHLGTIIVTFDSRAPSLPNYPIVAESNYPPTPDKGSSTSFGQNGLGEGTSVASAEGAKVVARTVSQMIEGLVDIGAATATNDLAIAPDKVRSTATSTAGSVTIAGIITIDGITGAAEAVSDGTSAKSAAHLEIGKVTVAGQAAYIDRDGVHVATSPALGGGVFPGLQSMVNGALATDGITVRTIAPSTKVDKATASATSGALAITIDRKLPATGVPGVPALEIPGAPVVPLGTPDLPVHVEILIGEARAGVTATTLLPFVETGLGDAGTLADETFVSGADFSAITGPGATLAGALNAPSALPRQGGDAQLGFRPTAESAAGKGIPVGWVIVGIFGALVLSGPLLGYARWQLLEGRQR